MKGEAECPRGLVLGEGEAAEESGCTMKGPSGASPHYPHCGLPLLCSMKSDGPRPRLLAQLSPTPTVHPVGDYITVPGLPAPWPRPDRCLLLGLHPCWLHVSAFPPAYFASPNRPSECSGLLLLDTHNCQSSGISPGEAQGTLRAPTVRQAPTHCTIFRVPKGTILA